MELCRFPVMVLAGLLALGLPALAGQAAEGKSPSAEVAQGETPSMEEALFQDGKGSPRLHLYDGEQAAVLSSDSSRSIVTYADGIFTRTLYDAEYRLQSRIVWKEGGTEESADPPKLFSKEEYFYYPDSGKKQRVLSTDFQGMSRIERLYSEDGLLVKEAFYHQALETGDGGGQSAPEGEAAAGGERAGEDNFPEVALAKSIEYIYNQDKKLTEKRVSLFEADGSQKVGGVQKTVYHTPGDVHGGYDYFEDNRLLLSRKYENESDYTETRYFGNQKIEALYSGARLLAEVVYLDGKEVRRTTY